MMGRAGVDLLFVGVAGFLDLAALVALLLRGEDAAEGVHLAENGENGLTRPAFRG
jgi:hypothetical protein